jgi:sorting nexin-8
VSVISSSIVFNLCFASSNHPVIKDDGVLSSFFSETAFDAWRKQAIISLEEESASKRVDRVEEMSIPSDLEEKIA